MRLARLVPVLVVSCSLFAPLGNIICGDTFGSDPNNTFEIEFVPIGQPGNPPYSIENPAGAVPYNYRIGKYEISEQMIDKANALGGLGITKDTRGPNKPATSVTWFEVARFVNWLNTDAGYPVAYKFDALGNFQLWDPNDPGYDATNLYRNKRARYVLPSIHEWHKAAYYDPDAGVWYDYPTGSSSVPDGIDFPGDPNFDAVFFDGGSNPQPNDVTNVGLLSPFGTAGQGGNVREWEETAFDRINDDPADHRHVQGGSLNDSANGLAAFNSGVGTNPALDSPIIGFRVALVPEPGALLLVGIYLFLNLGVGRCGCAARSIISLSITPINKLLKELE
jgi:hypothetical protein